MSTKVRQARSDGRTPESSPARRGGPEWVKYRTGGRSRAPDGERSAPPVARTGRGPLLDARRTAIRSGLLVGGAFPPTGCLTASAGFGAAPQGLAFRGEIEMTRMLAVRPSRRPSAKASSLRAAECLFDFDFPSLLTSLLGRPDGPNNLIQGNKVRHPVTARLSGVFPS